MLTLSLRRGQFALVYHNGVAIGAVLIGEENQRRRPFRVPVRFAGQKDEFEILLPKSVERRYGKEELDRATERFLVATPKV